MQTQTRQPAGVPTGGQFASSSHTEAEVSLAVVPDIDWGDVTHVQEGSRTPWGSAQWVSHTAPGIVQASTAGHGGVKLSKERNKTIPPALRTSSGWYEEDCEAAIVGMYHPEAFPHLGADYDHASSVREWFPVAYEEATGETVTAEQSRVRAEAQWKLAHAGELVVTSASRTDGDPSSVDVTMARLDPAGNFEEDRRVLRMSADVYSDPANKHPIGRFEGRFVLPAGQPALFSDVTPPPAPPAPPKPTFKGLDRSRGTDRQQSLVARDLGKRWRAADGSVHTLAEKLESDGFVRKSAMDNGNGRKTYYLVDSESHAYEVTKATWDAAEAPAT
jgi:hypothetical protein